MTCLSKYKIDCEKCSGLCCVALFFSKSDGFPHDKIAGKPCQHLLSDYRCEVHHELNHRQLKGCLSYDCLGAGQITTHLYAIDDWHNPKIREEIFNVFMIVYHIQQSTYYLDECLQIPEASLYIEEGHRLLNIKDNILSSKEFVYFDVVNYRKSINHILKSVISKITNKHYTDIVGKNFSGKNLDKTDFSMSLLIGANLEGCSLVNACFLGTDMRDVHIKNTDLSQCHFLTQAQINSAIGNQSTILPHHLSMPSSYSFQASVSSK